MSNDDKRAEYATIKAVNPVAAARYALTNRIFDAAPPVARTGEPAVLEGDVTPAVDPRAEERSRWEALKKVNPVAAARFALEVRLFDPGAAPIKRSGQ